MSRRNRSMMRNNASAWVVGGLVTAALVALGYWLYPEGRRTIKMHRM